MRTAAAQPRHPAVVRPVTGKADVPETTAPTATTTPRTNAPLPDCPPAAHAEEAAASSSLVTSAVITWNTAHLELVLERLAERRGRVAPDPPARISP
ncbi:hypothetical protein FHR84_004057 [Actinopolyspora biskrensis]|uniref:Uncharacterized protein n=1 Tax=Actinopolyspora biskrensis TaxID=1470178 RepID=A0A852Z1M7_9ACTN|nr:hypothetical protein [Actinopolyspora biskrensis]